MCALSAPVGLPGKRLLSEAYRGWRDHVPHASFVLPAERRFSPSHDSEPGLFRLVQCDQFKLAPGTSSG